MKFLGPGKRSFAIQINSFVLHNGTAIAERLVIVPTCTMTEAKDMETKVMFIQEREKAY